MDTPNNEIYTDIILDYYRHPKNFGEIKDAQIKSKDTNPMCGDVVEMCVKINGGCIMDAKFCGKGCAISQAAASMLAENIQGKSLEEVKNVSKEDVVGMLGIELSAMRLKCALLPLKVLKVGVLNFLDSRSGNEESINNEMK